MKRGRPSTGGYSRNSNYYVKKFRPSKSERTTIESYFKSVNSSSDLFVPNSSIEGNSSTANENISVCSTQQSSNSDLKNSVIGEIAKSTENQSNQTIKNTCVSHFNENNARISLEDTVVNNSGNDDTSDDDIGIENKQACQKHKIINKNYIRIYEKEYSWLYYSQSAAGFLCKVCSLLAVNEPKAWVSIGVDIKKNGHPTRICKKHELSKKHIQAVAAQEVNKRKKIKKKITKCTEAANLTKKKFNRKLIVKLIKILYFMIKKQWAVSVNFESLVRFLGEDLEDVEIKKHLEICGKNASYLSHISAENLADSISIFLEQDLLTKLACADSYTLMADECTDQSRREQLGLLVRYRLPGDVNVEEKYFGLINLNNSTAESITKEIEQICVAKNIDLSKCLFIALDGTNVMSGEHSGVQRRIKYLSPHCSYINCSNHKLALVFAHLLKKYDSLKAVDSLLISLWKLFHYSPKKNAVFQDIQKNVYSVDVLKMMKVSTTRWLSHGRACGRVASRYEQIIETLDSMFIETREPELKGLRGQLLDQTVLLTILFLADFLGKVDVLNLWLQSTSVNFSLVESKVNDLIKEVEVYCENVENGQCFQNSKVLLNLANECTSLSLKVRGKSQSKDVLKEFKENFVKNFLKDFKNELHLAFNLSQNNSNLKGFDAFNDKHLSELSDDGKQFDTCLSILISFYGEEKTNNFQDVVTVSKPIIDKIAIETEKDGFKKEMLCAKMNFDIEKTKTAQQLLRQNKKEDAKKAMESKITPNDLQMILEKDSNNWILYPNFMKLLSLCTIIPTSTASVERLFSRLNLLCTDLRATLKQKNLDRQLRIIVNGPKHLSEQQCEQIVDIFKMNGNRRLLL